MAFFNVGIVRTCTASRYIRVEADNKAFAEEKALEMAGNEDFTGCVTDYDFDSTGEIKEVYEHGNPVPEHENCVFCCKAMPTDMDKVTDEGWHPDYWDGQEHLDGPVCPDCLTKFCVLEHDEFVLKEIMGEFVSIWGSGHEFHTPCVVNPATRTVRTASYEADNDVEDLRKEYVVLDGKEYDVDHQDNRDDYTAAQQLRMFFWD